MRSKSALVRTRSGTYIPVPTMVAPRTRSGCADMIRLDLFPNVLVHALLHESHQGADRAPERARPAAAVTDEAHARDAEQRRGPVLFPIDPSLDAPQSRNHEQRAEAREQIVLQLLLGHVREQRDHALG